MKILVPTDFSRAADKALTYAIDFAEKTDSSILLYHSFIPLGSAFYSLQQISEENNLIREDLTRRLNLISKKANAMTPVKIESFLDTGAETKSIVKYAATCKAELIIMGTTGASGLKEKLLGSVTAEVMNNAPCPVIGVPVKHHSRPVKNIVFATDYRMEDLISLKYLQKIASKLKARMSIFHFNEGEYKEDYEETLFKTYCTVVKKTIRYPKLTFHKEKVEHIKDALNKLASEKNLDILAMNTYKRDSIFKRLMHKNLTKKVAYHTTVPLLSFPVYNNH